MAVPFGRRVPLILVFFFIGAFLWLFGGNFFPEYWEQTNVAVMVSFYVAMFFAVMFIADTRIQKALRTPLTVAGLPYLISFVATFIVASLIITTKEPLASYAILPLIIIQIAIVAPTEELMFRGVLLSYLGYGTIAIIVQAIGFAIWHLVVSDILLGITEERIIYLSSVVVFGVLMGYLVRNSRWGLPATMACHAAFNIAHFSLGGII